MSENFSRFCIVVFCGGIAPIGNGHFTTNKPVYPGSRYIYDTIATFTCNDVRFTPEYRTIRCQSSGQWTRGTPRCVPGKEFKFLPRFSSEKYFM